ncbi:MAG: hypothetical protein U9N85_13875 [Bacteroidota bacterium]|nr:hypothetical protein [Bacteroidota bacterium]
MQYNYEKNWFGNNAKLPAEIFWMVEGDIPEYIDRVELELYATSNIDRNPLIIADYRKTEDSKTGRFSVPVNYKLRSSSKYTVRLKFYALADKAGMQQQTGAVKTALFSYIDANISADKRSVELAKHPRTIYQELNRIAEVGMKQYKDKGGSGFSGFSQIIKDHLKALDNMRLKKARFNFLDKKAIAPNEEQIKVEYYLESVQMLKNSLENELTQYTKLDFYKLVDTRTLIDYPTEEKQGSIPVNIGYAGIYQSGGLKSMNYASAPYVGFSLPLGNSRINKGFLGRTSLSTGVMLQPLEFSDGTILSGPIIEKPLYLALGYKTAYFVRFNLGATLLQETTNDGNKLLLYPFIGASLEINLWLGLSR